VTTGLKHFALLMACVLLVLPACAQTPAPFEQPQTLPAMSGELARLAEVVFRDGINKTMKPISSENFGFGGRQLPYKAIIVQAEDGSSRDVEVGILEGRVWMIFGHKTPTYICGIHTSPAGEFVKGLWRVNRESPARELTSDEGQKLLVAEKAFWQGWLSTHPDGKDKTSKP
jgi:hypothetical protein